MTTAAKTSSLPRARWPVVIFLDAGPQHTEFVTQFLGPSECGKFDVLWEESDWTEDVTVAVAWIPRGKLQGFELWQLV